MLFRFLVIYCMVIGVSGLGWANDDVPGMSKEYSVIIEDNHFYHNNYAGLRVRGSVPVHIKECAVYGNGRAGIALDRHAEARVTGCDIHENGRAGINVDESMTVSIEDNRIYRNSMGGVRVWQHREIVPRALETRIVNNQIFDNDQGGIRSMPQGQRRVDLTVIGNEIYGNLKGGLRVENNTKLTAHGNNIYENGTVGIIAHESETLPELDIYRNTVSFNLGAGIHILNGYTGDMGIRNNWVFNNHRSGIICGLWGDPNDDHLRVKIINNTIVNNGSSGQGAGVRNDSRGRAVIMNNIIAYNYVSGIRTRRCRHFSHNLLFANGDVGYCCDDPTEAPYWIERLQVAGCAKRGRGDLITSPFFVDPDNYDFTLADDSPAIDAGKGYPDVSFPPSQGTAVNDIGATGGPYAALPPHTNSKFEARNSKP